LLKIFKHYFFKEEQAMKIGHKLKHIAEEAAKILWVVTPRYFRKYR